MSSGRSRKRDDRPFYKKPVFFMLIGLVACVAVSIIIAFSEMGTGSRKVPTVSTIVEAQGSKEAEALESESARIQSEKESMDFETESEYFYTVNFVAVGDNLIHEGLYLSGMRNGKPWNYDHLYAHIKPEVEAADIAYCNQETIFINDSSQFGGYPTFGGPTEIGDALVDAGFDVISHASNHTYDKWVTGIMDTIEFWDTKHPEIIYTGIHKSQEDADSVKTLEKNGIKFAFLNFTYSLNGFALPEDQPYLVDTLDDKQHVIDMIQKAKAEADVVVFFLHQGVEYTYTPSDVTYEWVQILLENGVDICIASHPHVLEPYALLTGKDGHQMLCYYSMGNMISAQDERPRLLGGMAKFTVQKMVKGDQVTISYPEFTMEPMYTHMRNSGLTYAVYMLKDYDDSLCAQNELYYKGSEPLTQQWIYDLFDYIMSTPIDQPGAAEVYQPWLENKGNGQQDTEADSGDPVTEDSTGGA